jgi:hypothetical protein
MAATTSPRMHDVMLSTTSPDIWMLISLNWHLGYKMSIRTSNCHKSISENQKSMPQRLLTLQLDDNIEVLIFLHPAEAGPMATSCWRDSNTLRIFVTFGAS